MKIENILQKLIKLKGDGSDIEARYGINYEDDTFMMHQFCWCEREDCPWCNGEILPQMLRDDTEIQECENAPNFLYKPTNFKLWWYKYIGRGMTQNMALSKYAYKQMKKDLKKLKGMSGENNVESIHDN